MLGLSVIIPAYKRENQTIATINLILESEGIKKEYDLEVIVADSSPNDGLEKALKESFSQKIIYVRPENPGIASNKNKGAKIASCPILIFCDSDMEVEKDTLLNTLKALKKQQTAGAVGGQVIWRTGPKEGVCDRPRVEDRIVEINSTNYIEAIYSRYFATYSRVFREVGGYDEEIFNLRGEGADLSIRYWRKGYPLIFDPSIIVHHVYEAPDSIALRIDHPEWNIAKDFLLLAYKYQMFDGEYLNFMQTLEANFKHLGSKSNYRLLQGIGKNLSLIVEKKLVIDKRKDLIKSKYDFKFLEIFTSRQLFQQCISHADELLKKTRQDLFV